MHPKESSRGGFCRCEGAEQLRNGKKYMEVSNGSIKGRRAESIYGRAFDKFLVREAEIVTWNRFSIDGKIRQGFFSEEELEENRIEEYSSWKSLKPICYSLIRGKRLPESFRIVFLMPPSARDRFVSGRVPGISPDQVGGLYINVQYENQEMICVTGTSMKQFTMDRTLENEWDENVRKFLRKNGVAVS